MARVAYYAHHHGSGHLQHARDLLLTTDHDVLVMSSQIYDFSQFPQATFVHLGVDTAKNYTQPPKSPYHYTPSGPLIQSRMFTILSALHEFKPDVVIVDVSVEVAHFVKLAGYKVLYRHMHGSRNDPPHMSTYTLADQIVAHYPPEIAQSEMTERFGHKITYTGMLVPAVTTSLSEKHSGTIVVMTSSGGDGFNAVDTAHAASETPDYTWVIIGKLSQINTGALPVNCTYLGFVDNPDTYLENAEIIISSGGHNAIARAASHRAHLIIAPEDRPYHEQLLFAQQLNAVTDIPIIESWQLADWPHIITAARSVSKDTAADLLLVDASKYRIAMDASIAAAVNMD